MLSLRSGIIVACCLLLPGVLAAAPADLDPSDQPKQMNPGQTARYYIWRDQAGWHIRTTTAEKLHVFQGSVHAVGGTIEGVQLPFSEGKKKRKTVRDAWKLDADQKTLRIELRTDGNLDGCNFQLSRDVRYLDFKLAVDGTERVDRIFIGQQGLHPSEASFKLQAVKAAAK